jgi:tetratricopeptide (TPR) repeat protein
MQEAVAEARRAHELDPLSWFMSRSLGEVLAYARHYEEAIAHSSRAVTMAPDNRISLNSLAFVFAASGRPEDELRVRLEMLRRDGRDEAAREQNEAYLTGGEAGMLRWNVSALLRRLEAPGYEGAENSGNRAAGLAFLYARLGDTDEALRWLDEAIRQRGHFVMFAKVHPALDNLRSDPRFEALLRRLRLA